MRTRGWPYAVFIAILVVLHLTIRLALGLGPEVPDLLTVAVLLAVRRLSGFQAAVLGLLLGLLHDAVSLLAFGAQAVTYTVLGYLGARSRDVFFGDSLLFVGLYLFLGKWLHDVMYYLIAGPALRGDAVTRFLIQAPVAALWAAAVGLAALLLYRMVSGDR
jgi:rod shape-determining protein MreD